MYAKQQNVFTFYIFMRFYIRVLLFYFMCIVIGKKFAPNSIKYSRQKKKNPISETFCNPENNRMFSTGRFRFRKLAQTQRLRDKCDAASQKPDGQ